MKEGTVLVYTWRHPITRGPDIQEEFVPPLTVGAKTEKSQDACLRCALRDGETSRAVLEERRERGVVQGVISAVR